MKLSPEMQQQAEAYSAKVDEWRDATPGQLADEFKRQCRTLQSGYAEELLARVKDGDSDPGILPDGVLWEIALDRFGDKWMPVAVGVLEAEVAARAKLKDSQAPVSALSCDSVVDGLDFGIFNRHVAAELMEHGGTRPLVDVWPSLSLPARITIAEAWTFQ